MTRLIPSLALAALTLSGCPDDGGGKSKATSAPKVDPYANDDPEPKPFEDWYPADITPPEGTQYPCPLAEHPLPKELPGIPNKDRAFINHVYSQILACTQAKLLMYKVLGSSKDEAGLASYTAATDAALKKIEAEPVPEGLSTFQEQVTQAIKLQQTFFTKAREQLAGRRDQASWKKAHTIPEGKKASKLLLSAWSQMQARYGNHWPPEMHKAIYHHLCALDLF